MRELKLKVEQTKEQKLWPFKEITLPGYRNGWIIIGSEPIYFEKFQDAEEYIIKHNIRTLYQFRRDFDGSLFEIIQRTYDKGLLGNTGIFLYLA